DDDVMGAWAHAANTPGDPGAGQIDNTADMLAVGLRHWFNPKTTIIASYAHMRNSSAAHYALGAGSHGVTWDCKDGGPPTQNLSPGISLIGNGTGCFTGTDRKSTRLNSSHLVTSYAVFCLKKKIGTTSTTWRFF